jgi:glutathione S-transferase
MKMRAVFRYRRLAHVFEMRNGAVSEEVADVRPAIIPMVRGPGDEAWRVDTTPIMYELEARHADRSILPEDAGDRFLAELIEDFGDEWLTKAMFHYRWDRPEDQDFGAAWIAADHVTDIEGAEEARAARHAFAEEIAARQISRMPLVGCTEANRGVIERTYETVLDALESHVGFGRFLFGSRPSIGDFGLFGQLKTLSDDPTPQALMRTRAPTVCHWVRQVDDLSGVEGAWRADGAYPDAVRSLLVLCGEAYLPFLSANAAAVEGGAEEVVLEIWGQRYVQAPFRYQAKCYARLRNLYAALPSEARGRIDPLLDETGCRGWLS